MKTFTSISDLLKKATRKTIYVELSNQYFAPVQRRGLKQVASSMTNNEQKFCGEILDSKDSWIQIRIA